MFTPSGVEAWAWFLPEYGYDFYTSCVRMLIDENFSSTDNDHKVNHVLYL